MTMQTKTGNMIIDSLEEQARERLLARAKSRPIRVGETLLEPGDPVTVVAFPTSGVLSLIAIGPDGRQVETANIGREGIGSVHSALGSRIAGQLLIGQVSGEMFRVDVNVFSELANEAGHFSDLVHG